MSCPSDMIPVAEKLRRGAVKSDCAAQLTNCYRDFVAGNITYIKNRPKIQCAISGDFFIKKYRYSSIWSEFRHLFLPSRARHCAVVAQQVARCGVMTPEVRGYWRIYGGWGVQADFLFTAPVPSEARFLNYAALAQDFPVETAIAGMTAIAAQLHNGGIAHGDLNLRNIFVYDTNQFGVIDLDSSLRFSRPLGESLRCRELARLISSFIKSRQQDDLAEVAEKFCQIYQELTGYNLRGVALERRILFLLDRVFPGRYRKGAVCRK